jgi:hypothetical protein
MPIATRKDAVIEESKGQSNYFDMIETTTDGKIKLIKKNLQGTMPSTSHYENNLRNLTEDEVIGTQEGDRIVVVEEELAKCLNLRPEKNSPIGESYGGAHFSYHNKQAKRSFVKTCHVDASIFSSKNLLKFDEKTDPGHVERCSFMAEGEECMKTKVAALLHEPLAAAEKSLIVDSGRQEGRYRFGQVASGEEYETTNSNSSTYDMMGATLDLLEAGDSQTMGDNQEIENQSIISEPAFSSLQDDQPINLDTQRDAVLNSSGKLSNELIDMKNSLDLQANNILEGDLLSPQPVLAAPSCSLSAGDAEESMDDQSVALDVVQTHGNLVENVPGRLSTGSPAAFATEGFTEFLRRMAPQDPPFSDDSSKRSKLSETSEGICSRKKEEISRAKQEKEERKSFLAKISNSGKEEAHAMAVQRQMIQMQEMQVKISSLKPATPSTSEKASLISTNVTASATNSATPLFSPSTTSGQQANAETSSYVNKCYAESCF